MQRNREERPVVIERFRVPLSITSVVLFLLCLGLPAYHAYEDTPGFAAFLLGPIGLVGGHFSWLANPVLAISWIQCWRKKYAVALAVATIAMLIAGTFLLQDTIPVGSSGNFTYKALSGYYVWLTSIGYAAAAAALGIFFDGRNGSEEARPGHSDSLGSRYSIGVLLFVIPAALAIGPIVLEKNRVDAAFASLCATAGEKITDVREDVDGIYLEQIGSWSFGNIHDGVYGWRSSGLTGEVLVNNGFLRFYEHPTETAKSYRRYDIVGRREQAADSLLSSYGVFNSKATSAAEEQLGIVGFETTVRRLATGELVATMRYFHHAKTSRICGPQDRGQVSETDFLRRTFHLRGRFFR